MGLPARSLVSSTNPLAKLAPVSPALVIVPFNWSALLSCFQFAFVGLKSYLEILFFFPIGATPVAYGSLQARG